MISAGGPYDDVAGSSSDGVRVTGGVNFGDSYTPSNPSFSGGIGGMQNGSSGTMKRSTDQTLWETWNAAGNDSIPRNPAAPFSLAAPVARADEFYRFSVSEN